MLHDIIAHKRAEVATRKARHGSNAFSSSLAPSDRSLAQALNTPQPSFILECKKASPSRGLIRDSFDVQFIARLYSPWADAISVITDERFFQGRLEYLTSVRQATHCPVLCKDFILDPWQVEEARAYGADAVLLMLSVLDDATYHRCARTAKRWNMDVLTEIHDQAELDRAIALNAHIIGINSRDLKTLSVDLNTVRRLAPQIPSPRLIVAESGIQHHRQTTALRPIVHGFLVGTHLMQAPNLNQACKELLFGTIKICGLTRPEQAPVVANAGAVMGGLIFHPGSKRVVTPDQARRIRRAESSLHFVGVFVEHQVDTIVRLASELDLHAVQLHGDDGPSMVAPLRENLPKTCQIWTRWSPSCAGEAPPAEAPPAVDRILCDTAIHGQSGGTGECFDWTPLAELKSRDHLILAGGLNPLNIADADALALAALDVNSGVESQPGIKDPRKLNALFSALRGQSKGGVM